MHPDPEPTAHAHSSNLIIVRPKDESEDQLRLLREIESQAAHQSIKVLKTLRLKKFRVTGGPEKDRPYPLLDPEDAYWLYSQLHLSYVAVLTTSAAYVRRDPSTDPARRHQLITLDRFVKYKGYWGLVRTSRDISEHLANLRSMSNEVWCSGPNDARILPLHVFRCEQDWTRLDDPTEQKKFMQEHGPSSKRQDCGGATWSKPKGQAARHGRLALRIGGYVLPRGFHWDVSPNNREVTIYFPNSVWKISKSTSYLNIYPDGSPRNSSNSTGCRKVWPKK